LKDTKNFHQAARELRTCLNRSQQSMATELGISIAALRNYESGATDPEPRAIAAYLIAAKNACLIELEDVFRSSLQDALGYPLWSLARPTRVRKKA
jgi:transcriptional regulator with XRE-family HTH domain